MANSPIHVLNHFLRTARPAATTDAELLSRYAVNRDESAFAELVRRHGPMVLGTAERIAGRDPSADDVFQTVFMALARRARHVRGEAVGGWLHRTTVRAALRARPRVSSVPCPDKAGHVPDPLAEVSWREVRQILDHEIDALPERHRVPLVLCYLEALTRDEAATRLGVPLRTFERRLSHGRALLQGALRRRGVSIVGLAAVAAGAWSRPLPAALVDKVANAVRLVPVARPLSAAYVCAASGLIMAVGLTLGFFTRQPAPAGDPPAKSEPNTPSATKPKITDTPDAPLPPGAIRRFGSLAWRHNGGIQQAVLSADGKTLATLSDDTLTVWDAQTGRRIFDRPGIDVSSLIEPGNVAIAPDGSWVAYTPKNAFARVLEIPSGKERFSFGKIDPKGLQKWNMSGFRSVWVMPDGKSLFVTYPKCPIILDAMTGKELGGIDAPGRIVAVSPDGSRVAVHDNSRPSNAYVHDAVNRKRIARLDGDFGGSDGSWFIRAAFSADGKRLATLSSVGSEVRVWDTETGKLTGRYERAKPTERGDDPRLSAVAIGVDGKTLYAGGLSGSGIRRWDMTTGKELAPWHGQLSSIAVLLPSPSGDVLFELGGDSYIRRWDVTTGKELPGPMGYTERAMAARSPDGKTVVTCDLSNRLFVWEAGTGRLTRTIELPGNHSGPPFAFSPDGKYLATSIRPAAVRVYEVGTWKVAHEWKLPGSNDDFVRGLTYLADGSGLFIGTGRDGLGRWNLGADKPTWSIQQEWLALAVAPNSKLFAISVAKGVSIRSVETGSELGLIPVEPEPDTNVVFPIRVDALAFSPDGSRLAATKWESGDVFVWETATGREVYRLTGHGKPEHIRIGESSVSFSPDGRWLATGHADKTTRIWDLGTGREARRLEGQRARVSGVQFGRDGKSLVTAAGVDVLLWDLAHGADRKANLESLWADMSSDDSGKAYMAMAALAARGDQATAFLRDKLARVQVVAPERIDELVAELDSDRFGIRETAMKALAELGVAAQPSLVAGKTKKPSAEGSKRIDELLDRLRKPLDGMESRQLRAVHALQLVGTDSARNLLKELAGGAGGARLTDEAKRSLRILDQK